MSKEIKCDLCGEGICRAESFDTSWEGCMVCYECYNDVYSGTEKVYSSEEGNRIWTKDLNPLSHKWEGLLVRIKERK